MNRRGPMGTFVIYAALAAALSCGWQSDNEGQASDGSFVTLRELDGSAQPDTQDLGVLVSVAWAGATAMHLEVLGGDLAVLGGVATCSTCMFGGREEPARAGQQTLVSLTKGGGDWSSFVIAIRPANVEALVSATLGYRRGRAPGGGVVARRSPHRGRAPRDDAGGGRDDRRVR